MKSVLTAFYSSVHSARYNYRFIGNVVSDFIAKNFFLLIPAMCALLFPHLQTCIAAGNYYLKYRSKPFHYLYTYNCGKTDFFNKW